MECNKEEAIRAKEIAEKKMGIKDFLGARRIALKAQQLYPDLDNISHVLSVCDVHCSAEHGMFGNEIDWYGILQIEQSADEASIKKQFRKFALLLHPDKNKFPGAESAFQLIGEAQRVLLDRGRRSLHDIKYKAFVRRAAPTQSMQHASKNSGVGNHASKQFTGLEPVDRQTFWTVCPFCAVKYQYYREVVDRVLRCQGCSKPFIACDIDSLGAAHATNCSQPACLQPKSHGSVKVQPQSTKDDHASNGGCHGNSGGKDSNFVISSRTRCNSEVGMEVRTDGKSGNVDVNVNVNGVGSDQDKLSGKVNHMRRRKRATESSESCDTGSCTDSGKKSINEEGNISAGHTFGCLEERNANVSYNGNLGDEEYFGCSPKRAKVSGLSCPPEEDNEDASLEGDASKKNDIDGSGATTEEDVKELEQKGSASFEGNLPDGNVVIEETRKEKMEDDGIMNCSEAVNDSASNVNPESNPDRVFYTFPDTDFSNFDKQEGCFKVGQIWACYDTMDVMPRFYARIGRVYSPGFRLKITWLDPDLDDEDEITWVNGHLPVACGKFVLGNTEDTDDSLMFSHLTYWEKGSKRDSYKIYPRIGETWALFKNWDIKWKSDVNSKRMFEFEFVEILSEYVEGVGVSVAHLGKVKGFSCLFCRTVKGGVDLFEVPPNQLLRFSHQVPSFKLTGEEREDVPRGSFELDPASLPTDLEEIAIPGIFEVMQPNGSCKKTSSNDAKRVMESIGSASMCQVQEEANVNSFGRSSGNVGDHNVSPVPIIKTYEVPYAEFYDFDADKSIQKFQVGQIWALYSDEDGLPKYYGQIKKIDSDSDFKVHLIWLLACSLPLYMNQWRDKAIPTCCGWFKLKQNKPQFYECFDSFSHQLRAKPSKKKDQYIILPWKGEIWALYKQWNAEMKCADLCNCDYDIVEILEENNFCRKVVVLERVNGFISVFKAQVRGGSQVLMDIPDTGMLRFSHRIPAFKLTKEREGSLSGFWELDPASLPGAYFSSE